MKTRRERALRVGLTALGTICTFKVLNEQYKKTNHYKNQWLQLEEYKKGIPKNVKMVNLGSTYSKYAFASYEELGILGCNMALKSQSIEMDSLLLQEYSSCFAPDCIVLFVYAPVTMLLYRDEAHTGSCQYYEVLSKEKIPYYSFVKNFKNKNPLIINPRLIRYLFVDEELQDLYSSFPKHITERESESRAKELVNCWKNLFGLKDLRSVHFSKKNYSDMNQSVRILKEMMESCLEKGFHPAVVIPPFSNRVNNYFSEGFVEEVLYRNINQAIGGKEIPIFDYRRHACFEKAYELFGDGGFCLNKQGSKRFMELLYDDIKATKLGKYLT